MFPRDRACAEAWAIGGRDAERDERQKWDNTEHKRIMDSVNSLLERRDKFIAERNQSTLESSQEDTIEPKLDVDVDTNQLPELESVEVKTDEPRDEEVDELIEVKINNSSNEIDSIFSQKIGPISDSGFNSSKLLITEVEQSVDVSAPRPHKILIEEIPTEDVESSVIGLSSIELEDKTDSEFVDDFSKIKDDQFETLD